VGGRRPDERRFRGAVGAGRKALHRRWRRRDGSLWSLEHLARSDERDLVVRVARAQRFALVLLRARARPLGRLGGARADWRRVGIGQQVKQRIGLEIEVAAERLTDASRSAAGAGTGARRTSASIARIAHRTPIPSISRKTR
jgi:hypothetical protein